VSGDLFPFALAPFPCRCMGGVLDVAVISGGWGIRGGQEVSPQLQPSSFQDVQLGRHIWLRKEISFTDREDILMRCWCQFDNA
jgi:hypothetical protein